MDLKIRNATVEDFEKLKTLFTETAVIEGGIARKASEITDDYMSGLMERSLSNGVWWVAEDKHGILLGSIHAFSPGAFAFGHVLSDLTICIHQKAQGQGVGRKIFTHFLENLTGSLAHITRVELMVRESNRRAIALYESLGFKVEGRFEKRVLSVGGGYEADIPMAWFKK